MLAIPASAFVFDHSDAFRGTNTGVNSDDLIDLKDLEFDANTTLTYSDDG